MPGPLLAIAASAGTRLIGAGLSRILGGKPKIPDLVQPAVNAAQASITDLETQQGRQFALAEQRAARAGTGLGSVREDILNSNARQTALIRGQILDSIANARQRQELVEADIKNRNRESLMSGIQSGFNSLGSGLGALALGDAIPEDAAGALSGTSQVVDSDVINLTPGAVAPSAPGVADFDPTQVQSVPAASLQTLPVQGNVPTQLEFVPGIDNATDPNVFARRLFQGLQTEL